MAQWWRIHLPAQRTRARSLSWEDSLKESMATHSSILAWKIPQRNLVGYSSWGWKESDMTVLTHTHPKNTNQCHFWAVLKTGRVGCLQKTVILLTSYSIELGYGRDPTIFFCCLLPKTQDRIWEFAQFNGAWTGWSLSWRQNSHMWGSSIWILVEINKMSRDLKRKEETADFVVVNLNSNKAVNSKAEPAETA